MNSTNRVLNRIFVFVAGLLILAGGTALALVATVLPVRDGWTNATTTATDRAVAWLRATPLSELTVPITGSWLWLIAIAAGVMFIVLLVLFSVRQGHGHTSRLVSVDGQVSRGAVVVEAHVAEHLILDALANHPELVASHVSTYRVKNRSVLKVLITCRRGVSPRDASQIVNEVLQALDAVLGRQLPALVQISGGFRARTSKAARFH